MSLKLWYSGVFCRQHWLHMHLMCDIFIIFSEHFLLNIILFANLLPFPRSNNGKPFYRRNELKIICSMGVLLLFNIKWLAVSQVHEVLAQLQLLCCYNTWEDTVLTKASLELTTLLKEWLIGFLRLARIVEDEKGNASFHDFISQQLHDGWDSPSCWSFMYYRDRRSSADHITVMPANPGEAFMPPLDPVLLSLGSWQAAGWPLPHGRHCYTMKVFFNTFRQGWW